jgi:DNA-binding transcriptional LysR family regulator
MIELRALKLFAALADTLHFGRTAEQHGVAQSVLSAQIRRIEDRIGARLLERGRRSSVALTPAGRTFLAEARLVIEQAGRAERIGRMAGRGEAGPARIGFVLSAALSGVLPDALAAIRHALPALTIEAEPMETPEQIAAIADGRLDLGFIRPRPSYPPGVQVRTVHSEDMLVALASDHPLAARPSIASSDLAGETFIFPQFGDSEGFADTIARLSGTGFFHPGPTLRTRDFVTAISLAAAGYGVVLAPRCMRNLRLDNIVFRPLSDHRECADLIVAYSRHANQRLIDVLLDNLPG